MKPRGIVIYRGPSKLDGKPIVVIATLVTANVKTGDMVQTWILRDRVSPIAAIHNGGDESICGDCPLRGIVSNGSNRARGCYVNVANAPRAVWESYRDYDGYPVYNRAKHAELFRGRYLRLGSYGDPVAAPLSAWRPFIRLSSGHSGYTHQWRQRRFSRWSKYIMASTHTIDENQQARNMGWRTFRTRLESQPLADNEIVCPASNEGGKRRTCATCLACDGGSVDRRSIAIIGHGSPSVLPSVNAISGGEL